MKYKLQTWHVEALVQAMLYLGAIFFQYHTLRRPEVAMALALWLLGRVGSRNDRQQQKWLVIGVWSILAANQVECANGSKRDLRLVSVLFAFWGSGLAALLASPFEPWPGILSWLTLADVSWTVVYPEWRKWYRAWRSGGGES